MNTVGKYPNVIPLRFRHARNTLSTSFKTLLLPCLYSDCYYSATASARLKEICCLLNRNANQKRIYRTSTREGHPRRAKQYVRGRNPYLPPQRTFPGSRLNWGSSCGRASRRTRPVAYPLHDWIMSFHPCKASSTLSVPDATYAIYSLATRYTS